MKKLIFIASLSFLLILLCKVNSNAQPCEFWDAIHLGTQEEVDDFILDHPDCTEILGEINIYGDEITNLNGLSHLTKLNRLRVSHTDSLTNLNGLENLTSISIECEIMDNSSLESIEGLQNVSEMRKLVIKDNYALESLNGLNNVDSLWFLYIENNDLLIDLEGLESVAHIVGNFEITDNDALVSLNGLSSLSVLWAYSFIQDNDNLESLGGLESLTDIFVLFIQNNSSLLSLDGMDNLYTGLQLQILNNESLMNIDGLSSLSDTEDLRLEIWHNPSLENVNGLSGISHINKLRIHNNDQLTNVEGLENLETVEDVLIINYNSSLSTCNSTGLCNFLENGGNAEIYSNVDGCNSVEQVVNSCNGIVSVTSLNKNDVKLFPNPTNNFLHIEGVNVLSSAYTILDQNSRVVIQGKFVDSKINVSKLMNGLYILRWNDGANIWNKRFVKID